MKHRIALALTILLLLTSCGTMHKSLGVLGLSTKNAVVQAASSVVCTAASVAQANQGIADSPLCKNGAATLECFAKTIAVQAIFNGFCGDGTPEAQRAGAEQIDANKELAKIFNSAGYTDAQAAMKVARLPRN